MTRPTFTVEEADRMLPELEDALARIGEALRGIVEQQEKLGLLDGLWGAAVRDESNPDHAEWLRRSARVEALRDAIKTTVQREVLDRGLRFPEGGLEHGLIDFPTIHEGRWVLLCWQRGEPHVRYWHELDGGFAGRQELTDVDRETMGRTHDSDPGAAST